MKFGHELGRSDQDDLRALYKQVCEAGGVGRQLRRRRRAAASDTFSHHLLTHLLICLSSDSPS